MSSGVRSAQTIATSKRSGEALGRDGTVYITGLPGKRDWYANLVANPAFTFHLKGGVTADLPARATPITDPDARRAALTRILAAIDRPAELDRWMQNSPLVAVTFDD